MTPQASCVAGASLQARLAALDSRESSEWRVGELLHVLRLAGQSTAGLNERDTLVAEVEALLQRDGSKGARTARRVRLRPPIYLHLDTHT